MFFFRIIFSCVTLCQYQINGCIQCSVFDHLKEAICALLIMDWIPVINTCEKVFVDRDIKRPWNIVLPVGYSKVRIDLFWDLCTCIRTADWLMPSRAWTLSMNVLKKQWQVPATCQFIRSCSHCTDTAHESSLTVKGVLFVSSFLSRVWDRAVGSVKPSAITQSLGSPTFNSS